MQLQAHWGGPSSRGAPPQFTSACTVHAHVQATAFRHASPSAHGPSHRSGSDAASSPAPVPLPDPPPLVALDGDPPQEPRTKARVTSHRRPGIADPSTPPAALALVRAPEVRHTPAMTELGALLPRIETALPGARSAALVETLARTECPALTARRARRAEKSGAPADPIVWAEAKGANVVDADGNLYVDMTAGFGVAALGHAHPAIVAAVRAQAGTLLHALGDVHPSDVKIALLERLAAIAPFPDARVILGAHGADAVEAALQTALLHTRKPGVVAFEGGYHGLSLGALSVCGYQAAFRAPFAPKLDAHVSFAPFPPEHGELEASLTPVRALLGRGDVGAVVVEPIQGRGGVRIPPEGFLAALGALAHEHGALLVADEIFTGLGRTGAFLRSVADGAGPDLLCLGKSLGGGLPISACLGRSELFSGWGDPSGEALRTATFLGHPLACAAALASLDALEREEANRQAEAHGEQLFDALSLALEGAPGLRAIRGAGMLVGIELGSGRRVLRVVRRLLERGWITLPAGSGAEVLELCPPLNLASELAEAFARTLAEVLDKERDEAT